MSAPAVLAVLVAGLSVAACGVTPCPPASLVLPSAATASAAPAKTLADPAFLKTAALTHDFRLGAPQLSTPTPDGKAVLFLRSPGRDPKQSLFELDMASGSVRLVLAPETLLGAPETLSPEERARRERMRVVTRGFTAFELSEDGTRILLTLSGRIFIVTRATGAVRELSTGGKGDDATILDPHLSPDGTRVAYVRAHDLYVVGTSGGPELAVTRGGGATLSHGTAEFVAEEEFYRSRGFFWSPDGAQIVYEEGDTSNVEKLRIVDMAHPEREPDVAAYPRAGSRNARVRFGVVSSRGGPTTWVKLDSESFPYIVSVRWERGGPLTMVRLDRQQREKEVCVVDAATGNVTTLLHEHDDAWLNVDPSVPRWLEDGSGFLWSSEQGGNWRLELRDKSGRLIREVTASDAGYRELLDVDTGHHAVTVAAGAEPTEGTVMRVSLDAGGAAETRAAAPHGIATARFGMGHEVSVVTRTSLTAWPSYTAEGGGIVRTVPAVSEAPSFLPQVEIASVGSEETRVAIVRPRGFVNGKKYPVIDAAYAGPGHQVVTANAVRFARSQWMADSLQAILVAIDARGTPLRGRAWERAILNRPGDVALEGHVATLATLGAKIKEMDLAHVGVFGWSYGGYFAALAVLARPDIYKVAVSGAPVVDWRDYDTAYTERYLGVPGASNPAYDAASLVVRAKGRPDDDHPGRPLLIIHGTADDNVYFLHSLKLVEALERAHRPFELMPLIGITHLPVDPEQNEALYLRLCDFLRDHLR
jgi:dipeptidyl-peptidase-4